jgi:hypothetical protein
LLLIHLPGSLSLASEAPIHQLRLLPVGDPPPFVQVVRDGARFEVPPPEGAIPPRTVSIPSSAGKGESSANAMANLRLRLGQASAQLAIPEPKNGRLAIGLENGNKWLDLPLHPSGSSLALVWKGPKGWHEASALVIADDARARTEGNVIFSNITASPMALIVGGENIRLDPGKTFARKVEPDSQPVALEIHYPSASGQLKLCHSAMLESARGHSRRLIIYAADGKKRRSPFKVLQFEEPVPVPGKPAGGDELVRVGIRP